MTSHENANKFMELIGSSSTLGEEIPPQTAKCLFLNSMIDPDYENIRATLKITKRNALLTECSQEIIE